MESTEPTPLLDLFRRGGIDRDVKLMAAQGELGLRPAEQAAICELLVSDGDVAVADAASSYLRSLSESPAAAPDGPPDRSDTPEPAGPGDEDQKASVVQKIARMSPAERLARATKGTREERTMLIRDPNRVVAVAVLSSPKITETEVESIAKMANVSDEVLRIIGHTRTWLKNYAIVSALTKNPKTPIAVSLTLLQRLVEKDVKMLATDRNIPEVLRVAARKRLVPK